MKTFFMSILFGIFIAHSSYAQNQNSHPFFSFGNLYEKHRAWEINISNGLAVYTGDVNSTNIAIKETHPCFGTSIYYHITDNVSTRISLLYGQLSGSDLNYGAQHANRNFTFNTNAVDITSSLTWEPWGHRKYNILIEENKRVFRFSPYIHVGFGLLRLNQKVNYFEEGNFKLKNQIEQDKLNTKQQYITFPFGVGWRYDINMQWTIGGEASFRAPFTDHLDGISLSANPLKRDWYSVATLNIGYRFKYQKDKDKDGVPDEIDSCPELPGFPNAKGCPDRDADGVLDKDDLCPDEKGIGELKGCPDQDNDGVPDYEDHCPYNLGIKKMYGCPDRDKDGVVDYKDLCPDIAGSPTAKGCPDKDEDGVMDKQDKCPNEKGTIASEGCPTKDWDNDGIPDYADACPDKAGDKMNNGCPTNTAQVEEKVIQQYAQPVLKNSTSIQNDSLRLFLIKDSYYKEVGNVITNAQSKIGFLANATKLKDISYPVLNSIIEIFKKNQGVNAEINVYSSDSKDEVLNKKLSDARARTIYYFLIKNGISSERLRYNGITQPILTHEKPLGEQNGVVNFIIF